MAEAKKRYIVSKDIVMNDMFSLNEENTYVMKENKAKNEAEVLFTRGFCLSNKLIKAAKAGSGKEKFKETFSRIAKAAGEADLAVAKISAKEAFFGKKKLYDTLPDFVEAVHDSGFSALIYSGDKNDLNNIPDSVKKHSFIMDEDGCSAAVFIVNDISLGLINYNGGSFGELEEIIADTKKKSEFVFVMSNTSDDETAEKIKAAGADYVVKGGFAYNLPSEPDNKKKSKLLKVKLIRDYEGNFEVEEKRISCKCEKEGKGAGYVIKPAFKREIKSKNGFQPQVSIKEICDILGASTDFYTGSFPLDKKVHSIIIRKTELDKGCVAVIENSKKKSRISAEDAVKAKALFIISDKPEKGLPTLVVEGDPKDAYIKLAKAIRAKYDPFTVGITGTVGKSTTTDLIKKTIGYGYNLLDVRGNYNYYRTVGFCIQKLSPEHDAYVQELHGGTKGAAKLGSNMILPNACVVTNIGDAHLSQVGTVEDVKREKLGIIDSLQPGGILVVNNDNEYLQNLDLPVKVVTYGIYNHDSDYHAENVVDHGDHVEFTIVCDEGRFDAVVYCPGVHNVGNAMAAFAVGRFAGIAPHRIIAALSRYRTAGVRQNIVAMDGYKIIADCFSATPDSMLSSLGSFKNLKTAEGGKHIAVIGDVADLGKKSKSWHREFGKRAHELGIEVLITLGEKAAMSAEAARELGMEAYDFIDRDEFENKICEIMRPGDNLLFKSSHPVDLAKSVDNLFGIK